MRRYPAHGASRAVPGDYWLTDLSGQTGGSLTEYQRGRFRVGRAYAGVFIVFSLVAQLLLDYAVPVLPGWAFRWRRCW